MAKVIFARSPFIVEINVASQTSTRLVLEIRDASDVLLRSYSFSKNITSTANIATYYNVSNFILEYLTPINPDYTTATENTNLYCKVAIKKYYTISPAAEVQLGSTENYLSVNGFTEYTNGMNAYLNVDAIALTSDLILNTDNTYSYEPITQIINYSPFINQFYLASNGTILASSSININALNPNKTLSQLGSYVDVLLQKTSGVTYTVKYTDGVATNSIDITPANTTPINKKIFLQSPYWDSLFPYTVGLYRDSTLLWSRVIDADEECKYTPSLCSFISKSGGWENVYFMKAKEDSSTMQNTTYNLLQDYNYNYLKGQKKAFNTNGNDFIKCNTGWVDESMNIILKDLLFSETILLDSKPVLIKNKSITYKNTLKDRLINYEMEFEYAYNLINNVV
jgi:hypothetical protein